MLKLTQELFGATDPDLRRKERRARRRRRGGATMQAMIDGLLQLFQRDDRGPPRPSAATTWPASSPTPRSTAQPISAFDAVSYYVIIATAGHDTTSSSTAGAHVGAGRTAGRARQGQGRPGADPGAGRRVHPLDDAGAPLHAHGGAPTPSCAASAIAKGDWLMLCYPSGNRDEDGVRGPVRVPRRPQPQPAPGLRLRRPPLPRPAPGQDGDAHPVGGTAAAPEARWSWPARPSCRRPISSTARRPCRSATG